MKRIEEPQRNNKPFISPDDSGYGRNLYMGGSYGRGEREGGVSLPEALHSAYFSVHKTTGGGGRGRG